MRLYCYMTLLFYYATMLLLYSVDWRRSGRSGPPHAGAVLLHSHSGAAPFTSTFTPPFTPHAHLHSHLHSHLLHTTIHITFHTLFTPPFITLFTPPSHPHLHFCSHFLAYLSVHPMRQVYTVVGGYFSGKMIRLVLLVSPAVAICAAAFIDWSAD